MFFRAFSVSPNINRGLARNFQQAARLSISVAPAREFGHSNRSADLTQRRATLSISGAAETPRRRIEFNGPVIDGGPIRVPTATWNKLTGKFLSGL